MKILMQLRKLTSEIDTRGKTAIHCIVSFLRKVLSLIDELKHGRINTCKLPEKVFESVHDYMMTPDGGKPSLKFGMVLVC